MNWQEVLTILVPLLGFLAWGFRHLDKKIDDLKDEIVEIKCDIAQIKERLARLEGRFEERGYWESRKTGTFDQKDL